MGVFVSESECQILFLQAGELTTYAVKTTSEISRELGIPLYFCDGIATDENFLTQLESRLLANSEGHQRKRLLIAGAYLEEQITICSLYALSLGYEVFLLKDFVAIRTLDHVHAFDMRLMQAGVVPTTLRQLLYEWLSQERLVERQAVMRRLLDMIKV
jgi:hypothetical protein